MIDLARDIIGTQPILTVFLAIGLGYLVGQIKHRRLFARRRRRALRRTWHSVHSRRKRRLSVRSV